MESESRIGAIAAAAFASAALLLSAASSACGETPVDNAERFIASIQGPRPEITGEYWFCRTLEGRKIGYGRVRTRENSPGGEKCYGIESLLVIETASGRTEIRTAMDADLRFRPLRCAWSSSGLVAGLGGFSVSASLEFEWRTDMAIVRKKLADKTDGGRRRIEVGGPPVVSPRVFIPLLLAGPSRNFMFSVVDVADSEASSRIFLPVENLGRKKVMAGGAEKECVEFRAGDEKHYFTPEGAFVMTVEGCWSTVACASEEQAKEGIEPCPSQAKRNWKSRATPLDLANALIFGMVTRDADLLRECFSWEEFSAGFAPEEQGEKPADRTKGVENFISGLCEHGKSMFPYHLLLAETCATSKAVSEDTAEVEIRTTGSKFAVKKATGGWKIASRMK